MATDVSTNPNKALWEKGDFTRIAASMRESGKALVDDLGISSGLRVLDLGCGDGTTAVPAAQRGADVLGVDIASNLVAAGNARAEELGLSNLRFQEGDASDLRDLDDESFDLVVSDVIMPRLSGPKLYAALRGIGNATPFLFTSGYPAGEMDSMESGPAEVAVLRKPWTAAHRLERVREALEAV